ncbi:MAG: type II toxin-antitoxin system death-on-curing family toxin [Sneathiella sp.]|nr:type II toxin-antitoxin system death-on-curing family toxin [Sneathiella sp.]
MTGFKLPKRDIIIKIQADQIKYFGGPPGIRDEGGIDAALERPHHLMSYGGDVDVFDVAASVAYSITKNRHPFIDGNKRVGAEICHIILRVNGWELSCSSDDYTDVILQIASGDMSEADFTNWCRENSHEI